MRYHTLCRHFFMKKMLKSLDSSVCVLLLTLIILGLYIWFLLSVYSPFYPDTTNKPQHMNVNEYGTTEKQPLTSVYFTLYFQTFRYLSNTNHQLIYHWAPMQTLNWLCKDYDVNTEYSVSGWCRCVILCIVSPKHIEEPVLHRCCRSGHSLFFRQQNAA